MQSQKAGTGRRTKIITEYRQTGVDADGDGYKYFTVSSSTAQPP